MTRWHRAPGERVFRALLRLYPREFREEFGTMMTDFYRERVFADSANRRGQPRVKHVLATAALQLRLFAELTGYAVAERMAPLAPRVRRQPIEPNGDRQVLANIKQDLRYAIRTLRHSPAFTFTVLATLALGIGANVAVFSVLNGVLLRPLPFADAERIVQLSNGDSPATISEPEVDDLRRDGRFFIRVGVYSYADGNVTGDGEAERVRVARVDAGFFTTLSPVFPLGRGFTADEDVVGAPDVVVISHGLWQRRFAMDSSVIGQSIVLNDVRRTVVGVTPPNFDYPAATVAIWVPLRLDRDALVTRNNHYLRTIARLAPGATARSADVEMRAMRDRWARDFPDSYRPNEPLQVDVRPIRDRVVGASEPYLVALFGAVGFVLLIACVNVANLLLVRGEGRRKEISLRAALGASRGRLTTQLALEGALLTVGGGLLGVATAWPVLRLIVAVAPNAVPRVAEIALDATALAFAAAVCTLVSAVFALAPLIQATRARAAEVLNSGTRGAAHAGGRFARRLRMALVVSEVALAVVMLAGAGVFIRTLADLRQSNLGFTTSDVFTARISLPQGAYDGIRATGFISALVERVGAMPGVTTAAAMAWTPIVAGGGNWSVATEEAPTTVVRDAPTASPQQVTPGFFEALDIPLRAGRTFTDADRRGAEAVVIVNETLARELWGNIDVLGRRLRMSPAGSPYMTVVGVVGDTRVDGITEPAPGVMYFPHEQAGVTAYFTALSMTLLIRSATGTSSPITAIREAVRELDPNVPLSEVRSMADVVASTIATQRFTTRLLSVLAVLALVLAAIGIYGVIAYGVTQRRLEFGIRMALGAGAGGIVSLVMREGLRVTVVGIALGVAGTFALGRVLRSLLADINGVDAGTMAGVSLILLAVALLALALPVRRAVSVQPTEALRNGS